MCAPGRVVIRAATSVATVIGVGVMIASFRGSVEHWLESTLLADFYVELDGWTVSADDPLADPDLATLAAIPGVRGLSLLQFTRLPTQAGDVSVRAIRPGPDGWGVSGDAPAGPRISNELPGFELADAMPGDGHLGELITG